MSKGTYQRFSTNIRNEAGELVTHDFFVKSRHATDAAARSVIPRLAAVLRVPEPTDDAVIAANVRHIKNSFTAFDTLERVADAPWIRARGDGCGAMLHASTCHFVGFDIDGAEG